jgi:hypothetical protein
MKKLIHKEGSFTIKFKVKGRKTKGYTGEEHLQKVYQIHPIGKEILATGVWKGEGFLNVLNKPYFKDVMEFSVFWEAEKQPRIHMAR